MHTIVFGDDRSPGSDLAWLWINDQRWSGWRVDVVTVPESELGPPRVTGCTAAVEWTPPTPRRALPEAQLAGVRHLVADADPRVVLGARRDADLLVVGASGHGFVKRRLHLGSTMEWLLHQPPAPLLIARSGRPVRRVLLGVDGSDASGRALQALLTMPWAADVHVLALGACDGWVDPHAALAEASALLGASGVEHDADVVRGRATEVLLRRARRDAVDLVSVGGRGGSTLRRAFAGSTATGVARAADSSVLVVP